MKTIKFLQLFLPCSIIVLLAACTNVNEVNGQSQWDFDHHVQFKKTQLKENHYRLEVIRNNKIYFNQLATFCCVSHIKFVVIMVLKLKY